MSTRRGGAVVLAIVLGACLGSTSAGAQDTRTARHEEAQAAKAEEAKSPTRNRLERLVDTVRKYGLFNETKPGFRPLARTIYPGGWLAFGTGYRQPLHDRAVARVDSAWSMKNFKLVDAGVEWPLSASRSVVFDAGARWIDAPAVAFYGIGHASLAENKSTYGLRPTTVGATATLSPLRYVALGGGADYLNVRTAPLEGPAQAVAKDPSAPGPRLSSSYVVARAFAHVDWRRAPGYSGTGGLYRLNVDHYADRGSSDRAFQCVEAEVVQLIPILRANWVVALRGLATATTTPAAGAIPFYFLPSIGGNSTVRGYSSFRFVDANRLVMNAELRWTPAKVMDAAMFYDAGKVAPRWRDLTLSDLKSSYGGGVRFHTTRRTVLRIELARNGEGSLRLVFSSGAAF